MDFAIRLAPISLNDWSGFATRRLGFCPSAADISQAPYDTLFRVGDSLSSRKRGTTESKRSPVEAPDLPGRDGFHATVRVLLGRLPRAGRRILRKRSAQSWMDGLVPERSFDAGTVAKGSKVRHTFFVVNRFNQSVHIASYKPKCGCTKVDVGSFEIPPGTQTTIVAVIDTTNFQGFKPSGLTLVFDRPGYAEVDLNFSCFIRTDTRDEPGGD